MRKIKLLKQTGNEFDEMFLKEKMLFGLNDLELLVRLAWFAMGVKDLLNKCCFEMIWTHALTDYRRTLDCVAPDIFYLCQFHPRPYCHIFNSFCWVCLHQTLFVWEGSRVKSLEVAGPLSHEPALLTTGLLPRPLNWGLFN